MNGGLSLSILLRSLCTSMRTTCSAITPRWSACVLPELGWPGWATSCSFTDLTMMSSMSVAGMRETDPTDIVLDSPLRRRHFDLCWLHRLLSDACCRAGRSMRGRYDRHSSSSASDMELATDPEYASQ